MLFYNFRGESLRYNSRTSIAWLKHIVFFKYHHTVTHKDTQYCSLILLCSNNFSTQPLQQSMLSNINIIFYLVGIIYFKFPLLWEFHLFFLIFIFVGQKTCIPLWRSTFFFVHFFSIGILVFSISQFLRAFTY